MNIPCCIKLKIFLIIFKYMSSERVISDFRNMNAGYSASNLINESCNFISFAYKLQVF